MKADGQFGAIRVHFKVLEHGLVNVVCAIDRFKPSLLKLRVGQDFEAVAQQVAHEGRTLTAALMERGIGRLDRAAARSLLQLELAQRGEASDLTHSGWPFMHWGEGLVSTAVAAGHAMRVVELRKEPQVALIEGLLSAAEAAALVALARGSGSDSWRVAASVAREAEEVGEMAHTPGTDNAESETVQERHIRGRHNSWCAIGDDHPLLRTAVRRVTWLCGLDPSHAEHCQVVHYAPQQEYQEHTDYFPPDAAVGPSGNRLVSVFVYLSGCARGGQTHFPQLDLTVEPRAGNALLWLNIDRKNELDGRTLHCGCPVLEGEKWGMNIWLRQLPHSPLLRDGAGTDAGPQGGAPGAARASGRPGAPAQTVVSRAYASRLHTTPTRERLF